MSVDESYQSDNQVVGHPANDAPGPQLVSGGINLGFILDFARRRLWVILFSMLFMCGVGFTYLMVVQAPYIGAAILKIDIRKFQLFQQPASLGDDAGAQVESHLEALKSENLALKVITELHLADDAEFGWRIVDLPLADQFSAEHNSEEVDQPQYERYEACLSQRHSPYQDRIENALVAISGTIEKLTGMASWYVPPDAKADAALDEAWRRLAGEQTGSPLELVVKGHAVRVPKAAMGVASCASVKPLAVIAELPACV